MKVPKRAKEREERSKEQMSEIEERKKKGNFNTMILFYSKPMYMKNNVARCIRAVQKRQEVNFNNSLLLLHNLILFKIIDEKKYAVHT